MADFGGLNVADWLIVVIVVASTLASLMRGFFREALSLAVWVGALVIAMVFSDSMQVLLADVIQQPDVRRIAGFIILFVATVIVGSLITHLVTRLIKASGLGGVDRVLGTAFGLARGVILVLVAAMIVSQFDAVRASHWYRDSVLLPKVMLLQHWSEDTGSAVWHWFRGAGAA